MTLKGQCQWSVALPAYGFLLVFNSNYRSIWHRLVRIRDMLQSMSDDLWPFKVIEERILLVRCTPNIWFPNCAPYKLWVYLAPFSSIVVVKSGDPDQLPQMTLKGQGHWSVELV